MGLGGISIWQLLIVLAIVVMLFGTKRLRNIGGDLGAAVKGFRNTMSNEGQKDSEEQKDDVDDSDASVEKSDSDK